MKKYVLTDELGIVTKKIICDAWKDAVIDVTGWVATGRLNNGTIARNINGSEIGITGRYNQLNIGDEI